MEQGCQVKQLARLQHFDNFSYILVLYWWHTSNYARWCQPNQMEQGCQVKQIARLQHFDKPNM